jgi:hypothetical protein
MKELMTEEAAKEALRRAKFHPIATKFILYQINPPSGSQETSEGEPARRLRATVIRRLLPTDSLQADSQGFLSWNWNRNAYPE